MELTGLNTDQAPPISVPLRFFLMAPFFAIFAALLVLGSDVNVISNRFSPQSIAIVHALTIGFMGFTILGAMTQMLPVVAGAKVYKVELFSTISHILLSIGVVSMVLGLYFTINTLNSIAVFFLVIGFLILIISFLIAIVKIKNLTPTLKAMIVSLIFSIFIVTTGAKLLYSYASASFSDYHLILANIHSVWAVFGFVGILIIGVSFQVLPMFYVAPSFKPFCKKRVAVIISVGLLVWLFLNIFLPEFSFIAKVWISLFYLAFSVALWIKLNKRRRPISDTTIWYWRSSSIFMSIGLFGWVINGFFDDRYIIYVSILIGLGFILSIMMGMLYKIVPFLVWFHLNAKGYMSIPTINEMINKKMAKVQYLLFIVSIIGFLFSIYEIMFLKYSVFVFMFSMIVLVYNILNPVLIYNKTLKTKPEFDMSAFKVGE